MSVPAVPSNAATLVLLRDRPEGSVEILLIQRHARSRFAGGDHVFAGGKIEPADVPADAERFCRGVTVEAAGRWLGLGSKPEALGYWVGAIREAFEEVGVLLAYGPDGALVRHTPESLRRYAVYREACHRDHAAFFTMLRAEALTLATDQLVYFAHWITPEESPVRFDTRFFAALMPPGQEASADGREITGVRWMTQPEAIAALSRKEISLRFPTIKNLELIGSAPTAAAAVEALRGREISVIRPRILTVDGRPLAVLPDDPRWY